MTVDPDQLVGFLQRLADDTAVTRCVDLSPPVPAGVEVRRDGRPVTEASIHRALTTQAILDEEERLVEWAHQRRLTNDSFAPPRAGIVDHHGLSGGQAEACTAVCGLAPLELIVGPAGTGKTTALVPAVDELQAQGRVVFGVASTAAAAEVLATETAMAPTRWTSSSTNTPDPTGHRARSLTCLAGSTVIVDEAGTVSTPKLAATRGPWPNSAGGGWCWLVTLASSPRWVGAACSPTSSTPTERSNWTRCTASRTGGNETRPSGSATATPACWSSTTSRDVSTTAPDADMETEILDACSERRFVGRVSRWR